MPPGISSSDWINSALSDLGRSVTLNRVTIVESEVSGDESYSYGAYTYTFDDDIEDMDEFDELGDSVTEMVITMFMEGVGEKEIREEVSNYLRNIY